MTGWWGDVRVAVIGGAGFLGSHLVERLAAEGRAILVVDDLSTGRLENLAGARRTTRISFHSISAEHPHLGDAVERFAPDAVDLLADPPPADLGRDDPVAAVRAVAGRVAGFCTLAAACDARLVIGLSAVDLYGAVPHQPVKESQRPHPLHPYGGALYAGLRYVEAMLPQRWCGLAIGTVYGPRQYPAQAEVPAIARDMLRRRVPDVYTDAGVARDYVYVDDAVDAVARAVERGRGLVNVGTGVATPLSEVVAELGAATSYVGSVRWVAGPAPGPVTLALDPAGAASRLGWRHWTSLGAGLTATVAWLQGELAGH